MSFVDNWFSFVGGSRRPWFDFAGGRSEMLFALVFVFIGIVALVYSAVKVRGTRGQMWEYFIFLPLLVGSTVGVVYARNLLLVFVCWEVATFALWRLVMYYRSEEDISAASWAWYVNFGAAALMLVGFAMLLFEEKTVSLDRLGGAILYPVPAILILIGILAKSATIPLYVWMPKAYRQAPAPVCALLSGVAENIGVVLFYKLFVATVRVPDGFMFMVAVVALISSLVAGGVALRSGTLRGTLAYSTISQLGFVFLGLAMVNYYGLVGGLLYVIAHALAKTGLFFAAGLVEDAAGTDEYAKLGGVARRSPVLAAATALLAMSVMGLPPMLGFFAKLGVILGALSYNILFGVGAAVAALFTLLYLVKMFTSTFLGAAPATEWRPLNRLLVGLVALMALVSVASGLVSFVPVGLIAPEVAAILGAM